jgi:dienelactone hydrolase
MTYNRRNFIISWARAAALLPAARLAALSDDCSRCSPCDETVNCLDPQTFTDSKGIRHTVYVAGKGPPVLLLHELPGMTRQDIRLAKKLVCEGYTVLAPLLFGIPGGNRFLHFALTICGKDQFDCGGSGTTPPAVNWIREYCNAIRKTRKDGLGLGVVGMCLTGEFPVPLLAIPEVKAAVMCQPTNPFNLLTLIKLGPGSKLSLSDDDVRNARKSGVPILGIKYSGDHYCPDSRFETLARLFPKQFYWLELEGNSHSSLGEDLCDTAFEEVRLYLGQQLKGASPVPGKSFPNLASLTTTVPKRKASCPMNNNPCKS